LLFVSEIKAGEIIENKSYQGQKTTIRWAFWGGESTVKLFRKVVEKFVETHPKIAVDMAIYPWGQYWSKLQTQVAAGLAPDVISMFGIEAGAWIEHGAFLPLDQYIRTSQVKPEDYYKGAMDSFRWHDKQYVIPIELAVGALVYSVDKLEAQGISPEELPKSNVPLTWEQYKSLVNRLTLRDDRGNIKQYGIGSGGWWNDNMYGIYGGEFFDRPANPTKSTIRGNEPLAKAVVEVFQDRFAHRVQAPAAILSSADFGGDMILQSNSIATAYMGPWVLPEYAKAGVRVRSTPIPLGKEPHQLFSANGVGIYTTSQHKAEAWELVQFLAGAFTQQEIGRTLRGLPALKSAKDSFIHNEFGIEGTEAFLWHLEQSENSGESYLCAPTTAINQMGVKWNERMELHLGNEYDRRMLALQAKGTVTNAEYNEFVAGMNKYVDGYIRKQLNILDGQITTAFAGLKKTEPTFFVKVLLPLIILLLLVSAAVAYIVSLNRGQREGNAPIAKDKNRPQAINWSAYLALSPWVIGLVCFTLGPVLISIYLSFTDWNMIKPPQWVGAQHYLELWTDHDFILGLEKTFGYAFWVIPISLIGGIFTAALLTSDVRGADAFKAIFYFPSLFTGAAATVLWINMFHREYGVANHLLRFLGFAPVNFLDEAHAFMTVILMNIFWVGGATIIYYAGMKQIPRSLYEAAEIDGAGTFKRFFKITLPLLSPVILFMVITTTIGAFQVFTPALFFADFAISIGGPGESLKFYSVNIYNEAFNNLKMGKACAYAVVLFVIIFFITMAQFKISKRFVHTETD
jgi:multiple sugar transport system permease protein